MTSILLAYIYADHMLSLSRNDVGKQVTDYIGDALGFGLELATSWKEVF